MDNQKTHPGTKPFRWLLLLTLVLQLCAFPGYLKDFPPEIHGERTEWLLTGESAAEAVYQVASSPVFSTQPQEFTLAFAPSGYEFSIHHGRLARIQLNNPTTFPPSYHKHIRVLHAKIIPASSDEDDLS